jgi:hypothetical protein
MILTAESKYEDEHYRAGCNFYKDYTEFTRGGCYYTDFDGLHCFIRKENPLIAELDPLGFIHTKGYHNLHFWKTNWAVVHRIVPLVDWLKELSEEKRMRLFNRNTDVISHMPDASEEMKLKAVKQNGKIIQCIKDPSDVLKLAAVAQNGDSIQYIMNPTE